MPFHNQLFKRPKILSITHKFSSHAEAQRQEARIQDAISFVATGKSGQSRPADSRWHCTSTTCSVITLLARTASRMRTASKILRW